MYLAQNNENLCIRNIMSYAWNYIFINSFEIDP